MGRRRLGCTTTVCTSWYGCPLRVLLCASTLDGDELHFALRRWLGSDVLCPVTRILPCLRVNLNIDMGYSLS